MQIGNSSHSSAIEKFTVIGCPHRFQLPSLYAVSGSYGIDIKDNTALEFPVIGLTQYICWHEA